MAANEDNVTGSADIPPLPPGAASTDDNPTAPIVPDESTPPTAPAPPRPFFQRTWVRVTGAAVAALILFGTGMGVGAAVTNDSDGSAQSRFGPGADPDDDGPMQDGSREHD